MQLCYLIRLAEMAAAMFGESSIGDPAGASRIVNRHIHFNIHIHIHAGAGMDMNVDVEMIQRMRMKVTNPLMMKLQNTLHVPLFVLHCTIRLDTDREHVIWLDPWDSPRRSEFVDKVAWRLGRYVYLSDDIEYEKPPMLEKPDRSVRTARNFPTWTCPSYTYWND